MKIIDEYLEHKTWKADFKIFEFALFSIFKVLNYSFFQSSIFEVVSSLLKVRCLFEKFKCHFIILGHFAFLTDLLKM